ncbi:hypothetical protein Efla_000839 [Eimeria flavescens]
MARLLGAEVVGVYLLFAAAAATAAATAAAGRSQPLKRSAAGGGAAGGLEGALIGPVSASLLQDTDVHGWQAEENHGVRTYVCRYSQDGGPCKDRAYGNFPAGLQCPPNHCCSKTHIVHGQSGQWQEDSPLGGAYCVCKDGYLGDGKYCEEDKCRNQPCYPGQCVLVNQQVQCNCPENYEVDRSKMPEGCKVKDMCKSSPCGDTRAAKACYHEGPGRYSCECNLGYVPIEVNGKLKCDDIFNHFVCASSPCGVTGLQECLDTPTGVKCTCLPGYSLVKETARYTCVRKDPCLSSPCGTSDVVSSCVATSTSYVCTCKDGYKVVSGDKGQFCAVSEEGPNYALYAGVGGGVLLLLFGVFACNYMRQGPELTEEEVQFMQQNGGPGVSDTAFFDATSGWQ